jgi:hypothetical protein
MLTQKAATKNMIAIKSTNFINMESPNGFKKAERACRSMECGRGEMKKRERVQPEKCNYFPRGSPRNQTAFPWLEILFVYIRFYERRNRETSCFR